MVELTERSVMQKLTDLIKNKGFFEIYNDAPLCMHQVDETHVFFQISYDKTHTELKYVYIEWLGSGHVLGVCIEQFIKKYKVADVIQHYSTWEESYIMPAYLSDVRKLSGMEREPGRNYFGFSVNSEKVLEAYYHKTDIVEIRKNLQTGQELEYYRLFLSEVKEFDAQMIKALTDVQRVMPIQDTILVAKKETPSIYVFTEDKWISDMLAK